MCPMRRGDTESSPPVSELGTATMPARRACRELPVAAAGLLAARGCHQRCRGGTVSCPEGG